MASRNAGAATTKADTTGVPGLPDKPGRLPGAPRQRRRPRKTAPVTQWTPAQAREMAKRAGRPKGSITQAYSTIYELAKRICTDPTVQNTMLFRAQMGTLDAATMRDLMYTYGGRPAYKMQVQRTVTTNDDEEARRQALLAMSPERRRMLADLLRETQTAYLALPQRTEAEDAEIVSAP